MKYVKLQDVCAVQSGGTPSRQKEGYWKNGSIPWVKISDFSGKYLLETTEFITQAGLDNSSAKIFPEGTVLYSIFATLGEVAILTYPAATNQAIAGLKIKDNSLLENNYLYYFLKSIKNKVANLGRGVAQNNINLTILKGLEIPLPPLAEQERIAAELDAVAATLKKRQTQLAELNALVEARFVEMFGDPSRETRFPTQCLTQLGELNRGVSKHRPRNAPELLGGPYPLIQTGDVANAELYILSYQTTYSELGLAQSRLWKAGALCITIAANIAKTAILTFDACFPDSVVGFIPAPEKTNAVFIRYWFAFFQKILEDQAPQVAQKNINLKILSELQVIVPPLAMQERFAAEVERIEAIKATVRAGIAETQTLFDALSQNCFG